MNAPKQSQAIFSNSPNHLLAKLAKDLFSIHQQPFSKRWILVPNAETGHWLRRELIRATSNHTFMGSMIFSSYDSLIKHLSSEICHEKPLTPDYITLPLFIHEAISNIFFTSPLENQARSSHLQYAFTKKLGSIFKKFYTFSQIPSGKNRYYQDILSELLSQFPSLNKVFSLITSSLQSIDASNCSLYIFGYSHLPQSVALFFTELNQFFPVYFYCFSPSQAYFGDLLSDKAIDFIWRRLQNYSNLHAWENYVLSDRQSLLANLSCKFQISHNFFLDKEIDYCEEFIPPPETTTLGNVQSAIFYLHPSSHIHLENNDSTLTISEAAHPSREVHEAFSRISHLLYQGVPPEEIFILTSQLSTYEVYLKGIFSPHIPLYFTRSESSYAKELKEKFLLLSTLLQTQGDLHSLLQILSHPKLHHSIESQHIPFLWKKISQIWNATFKKQGKGVQGVADAILSEYPFIEEPGRVHPLEIWEKLLPLLYDLQQFIEIYDENHEKTYEEHVNTIFAFLETIFLLSPHELSYITSLRNSLSPKFSSLKCSLAFFCDFCLDFFSYCHGNSPLYNQPGPYVGSLEDLSFIPKGHTFILGANKTSSMDFLDLVDNTPNQEELLLSSQEDEENFHFLQTLISTKHSVHISYLSSSISPALPSAYVNHLQDNLNLPLHRISSKAYTPSLFQKNQLLHISQEYYYRLAQSFFSVRTPLPSLFPVTPIPCCLPDHLEVSEIVRALTSPLDFFLKSNYQVSLSPPYIVKTQEKLFPTKKDIFSLWSFFLSQDKEIPRQNYLSEFSKEVFASHEDKMKQWLTNMREHPSTTPYTVIFSSSLFHNLLEKDLLLPPLPISWDRRKIYLHSQCLGVCSSGVYLCAFDSSPTKKRKTHSDIPETTLAIQNYLHAQISLAMLQCAGVLDSSAAIYRITSLDSQDTIPPAFSDPEDYLCRVLHVYNLIQEQPIPLTSASCWQSLPQKEKLQESIQKTLANDIHNPELDIFWKFHNRVPLSCVVQEEHRLLILSLFKETHAAF